jgi:hypothetical protein
LGPLRFGVLPVEFNVHVRGV